MKILSMPAGQSTNYIYENGIFNVGIDNPGTYVYTAGWTSNPATLDTLKVIVPVSSAPSTMTVIGTSGLYDFSSKSVLKVRCKVTSSNMRIFICTDKTDIAGSLLSNTNVTSTVDHVESIDISAVTNAYLCFGTTNGSGEIYEISCE